MHVVGSATLAWHKRTSLWNYDRVALDQMITFEKKCLPVHLASVHVCCPSSIVMKVLRPVMLALNAKYSWYGMSFHDVLETEIAPLNIYHSEWVANRRSFEMTETYKRDVK
jgi:hypothetical protein